MNIQRVSFTSAATEKTNKKSTVKENNSVPDKNTNIQTETKQNLQQDKTETGIKENLQKTNSNMRNWVIGISSLTALIILGITGRKVKLGKGIQKFLGGGKKDIKENVQKLEEELSQQIKKSDEQLTQQTKIEAPIKPEKQPIYQKEPISDGSEKLKPETNSTQESAVKTETNATTDSKPNDETVQVTKIEEEPLTEAEKIEINSKLDRTIPKVPEELITTEPKTLDSFMRDIHIEEDLSKYKNCLVDYTFHQPLPTGGEAVIHRNAYNDVSIIVVSDAERKKLYTIRPGSRGRTFEEMIELQKSKNLTSTEAFTYSLNNPIPTTEVRINKFSYYYENGKLIKITNYVTKDDHYMYNPIGDLYCINHFTDGQTSKLIFFNKGSNLPIKIKYFDKSLFGAIKEEIIENGIVKDEIYDVEKIRSKK